MYRGRGPTPSSILIPKSGFRTWQSFTTPASRYLRGAGVLGVRVLDGTLRFCLGIREFSRRSDCILRVSTGRSSSAVSLPNDIEIRPGDHILELHFWNEHLVHCQGPHGLFGWAICIERRIRFSLMLLADEVAEENAQACYEAVRASLTISLAGVERVIERHGFTIVYPTRSLPQKIHDYLEGFLIGSLLWAFHPYGARRERGSPRRVELWISRSDFLRLYGTRVPVLDSNH